MPRRRNGSVAFNVYLGGKLIDTVFHAASDSAADVRRSLVEHDGYSPSIKVTRAAKKRRNGASRGITLRWYKQPGTSLPEYRSHAIFAARKAEPNRWNILNFTVKQDYGRKWHTYLHAKLVSTGHKGSPPPGFAKVGDVAVSDLTGRPSATLREAKNKVVEFLSDYVGEERANPRRNAGSRALKYEYLYVLQGQYGHGWEDIAAEAKKGAGVDLAALRAIRQTRKEYQQNEGGRYRVVERREKR